MRVAEQLADWKGLLMVSLTACLPSSKGPDGVRVLRTSSPDASLLPASTCSSSPVSAWQLWRPSGGEVQDPF